MRGNSMAREKGKKLKILGISVKSDYLLGLSLVFAVAAYATTKFVGFAYASLLLLLFLFLRDAMPSGADKKSIGNSVFELVVALVAALALWYGLGFILQTPTPIDVVTSCSMLPALDRGDLIILQGGGINAREAVLSRSISLRDFTYVDCKVRELDSGTERDAKCASGLTVDGVNVPFDKDGDIVVYEPVNPYRNLGLIVHRAVLKMHFKGETYYLIKGDNNLGPDIPDISIDAAKMENIKGRVILRVPWLGYLKLFLSLQFNEPDNCRILVEEA